MAVKYRRLSSACCQGCPVLMPWLWAGRSRGRTRFGKQLWDLLLGIPQFVGAEREDASLGDVLPGAGRNEAFSGRRGVKKHNPLRVRVSQPAGPPARMQ